MGNELPRSPRPSREMTFSYQPCPQSWFFTYHRVSDDAIFRFCRHLSYFLLVAFAPDSLLRVSITSPTALLHFLPMRYLRILLRLVSRWYAGQCSCEAPTAKTYRTSFPRLSSPCTPASQKPQEVSSRSFPQNVDSSAVRHSCQHQHYTTRSAIVTPSFLPVLGMFFVMDRHKSPVVVVYKIYTRFSRQIDQKVRKWAVAHENRTAIVAVTLRDDRDAGVKIVAGSYIVAQMSRSPAVRFISSTVYFTEAVSLVYLSCNKKGKTLLW